MKDSGEAIVAVTGVGVVSALGCGRERFWSTLGAGHSGIATLEGLSSPAPLPRLAAQVRDFAPREFIASANLRRMGRVAKMVVAASRMALDDARIAPTSLPPDSLGVIIGSAIGEIGDSATYLEKVFARGPAAASPLLFPNLVLNGPASYVSMELGAMGVNFTVAQGEVSGEEAVLQGCRAIRAGRAQVVLAGGGDELSAIVAEACTRVRSLSGQRGGEEWCSPYDRARNGIVLGEGAAILVLESLARARARGAAVLAVIEAEESFSVPAPLYDWPASAAAAVDAIGRLARGGVDLVVGSANSSPRLDACEIDLYSRLFRPAGDAGPAVTSIKGAIGEFGAAGALSLAAASLALHEQAVPPLCNLRTPEPAPLRFAARDGRSAELRRAMVTGFSRGGAGVAIVLGRGHR